MQIQTFFGILGQNPDVWRYLTDRVGDNGADTGLVAGKNNSRAGFKHRRG
jgi:hypothetical protein